MIARFPFRISCRRGSQQRFFRVIVHKYSERIRNSPFNATVAVVVILTSLMRAIGFPLALRFSHGAVIIVRRAARQRAEVFVVVVLVQPLEPLDVVLHPDAPDAGAGEVVSQLGDGGELPVAARARPGRGEGGGGVAARLLLVADAHVGEQLLAADGAVRDAESVRFHGEVHKALFR